MIEEFVGFTQRRPRTIIIAVILITALFLVPLSQMKFNNSTRLFFPTNVLEPLEKLENLTGTSWYHEIYVIGKGHQSILTVEALQEQLEFIDFLHNNFDVETTSAVEIIEKELNENYNKSIADIESDEELGEAAYGLFKKSPRGFRRLAQTFLDRRVDIGSFTNIHFSQQLSRFLPFFEVTPDRIEIPYARITTIYIEMDGGEEEKKQTSVMIRKGVDGLDFEHIKAMHESLGLISYDIDQLLAGNAALLAITALVSMSLLIFLNFRRLYFVFIPFFITAIAFVWTFGTAVLLGLEMTAVHTIIIALLVGIALDGPLHLTKRFVELRKEKEFSSSLKETFSSMLPPLSLAFLTTVGAFAAQMVLPSPVAMLSFTLVVIIGVTYSFLLVCLLWPALMAVKTSPPVLTTGQTTRKAMNWVYGLSTRHSKAILAILVVFLLLSVNNAGKIKTDVSTDMLLPDGLPSKETQKIVVLNSARYGPNYILIGGNVSHPEILPALDRLEENIQDNEFFQRIGSKARFESVNVLLREFNASNTTDLEKSYDELYESTAMADPVTGATFADKTKAMLYKNGSDYDYITAKVWVNNENDEQVMLSYDDLMEDIGQSGLNDIPGITIDVTGMAFAHSQSTTHTREVQIVASALMFVFTFLVLLLIYRKLVLGVVVSIPIIIGSVFSLGLMPLLEIPLTTLSATVIPIAIGLGIDYSIYLTQRYREELKRHECKEAARIALEQTGEGNWLAASTTTLGFFIISFSILPMAESFGILTGLTIMLTFLTTIFLLPILLIRFVKE